MSRCSGCQGISRVQQDAGQRRHGQCPQELWVTSGLLGRFIFLRGWGDARPGFSTPCDCFGFPCPPVPAWVIPIPWWFACLGSGVDTWSPSPSHPFPPMNELIYFIIFSL